MGSIEATLSSVAHEISRLIGHAPAGGVFTDVHIHGSEVTLEGLANERRSFIVRTQGRQFEVSIEQLRLPEGGAR